VLPKESYSHAVVYLAPYIYVFGGAHDDAIIRLNPDSGESSLVGRMPVVLERACGFTDGSKIYIVGGVMPLTQRTSDRIYQFDPAMPRDEANLEKAVTQLPALLPDSTGSAACGYDGKHLYILGGSTGDATRGKIPLNQVVRFTPSTGQVKRLRDRLPRAMEARAAAFHSGALYIFGGSDPYWLTFHDNIYRYVPGLEVPASTVPAIPPPVEEVAKLPLPLHDAAIAELDGQVFVIGGFASNPSARQPSDGIFTFDPRTKVTSRRASGLPVALGSATAVSTGLEIFVFGGAQADGQLSNAIQVISGNRAPIRKSSVLPQGVERMSGVWLPPYIYLMGGSWPGSQVAPVLRYHPATDVLTQIAQLPAHRDRACVFTRTDSKLILVAGGVEPGLGLVRSLLQFDPSDYAPQPLERPANAEPLPKVPVLPLHELPHGVADAVCASDGRHNYLLGGQTANGASAQIIHLDSETFRAVVLDDPLPAPRRGRGGVLTAAGEIYLLGGDKGEPSTGVFDDAIWRYVPRP
jgi:N-acetylneuraminic acid mutarotase